MPLLDPYLERCRFPDATERLCCAVSGGADSLALLALACATGRPVLAVHVDHGLREGSDAEADVVRAACEQLGAEFHGVALTLPAGPNLEARARAARYAALPADALTGHTADDHAETVLLQLLRGSGLDGVSGIGSRERRPILALRRADTEQICSSLGLRPVDDPSNSDPTHRRNRIRHEVLPLLAEIADRDVVPLLTRHAALAAEAVDALRSAVECVDPTNCAELRALEPALARIAVRRWLQAQLPSGYPPDLAAVDRVLDVVGLRVRATEVAGGWRIARTDGRLRLEPPRPDGIEPS